MYANTGKTTYLEQATNEARRAMDLGSKAQAGNYRNNYAGALWREYQQQHDLLALDTAIVLQRDTVRNTSEGSPDLPERLHNLGTFLLERASRVGSDDDLIESIEYHEKAVASSPVDAPSRDIFLAGLGIAYRFRAIKAENAEAMHLAIATLEKAAAAPQDSALAAAQADSNLAIALIDRHAFEGNDADLDRAVELLTRAVRDVPSDSPDRPLHLNSLGIALRRRYRLSMRQLDLENGITAFREAARSSTSGHNRALAMLVARNWAEWASERTSWSETGEALENGVRSLQGLSSIQIRQGDKEAWLRQADDLSSWGALAFARGGQVHKAVELLESGRSLILSEALERDTRMESLIDSGHSALAERLRQAWGNFASLGLEVTQPSVPASYRLLH
jgi:tetratricopeptide (TPR) repeat protein